MRVVGLLLAVSSPISGLVSYAVAAVILGEERLEGADGLTTIGWCAVALPLVLGVAVVTASFLTSRSPNPRLLGAGLAVLATALVGLGLWSQGRTASGDASIGGGLLILTGTGAVAAAASLLWSGRTSRPGRADWPEPQQP